jgi:HAD superfamily hydrolase (TIGR01549 family)
VEFKLKENKFKAIVFDLDGTLVEIDNIKKHADEVLRRTLYQFGVKRISFADRYEFYFCGIRFIDLLQKWGITTEKQRKLFLETLSGEEYVEKKTLIEQGSARLYGDASILDALKGRVKLGLVTNSSAEATSLELNSFRIKQYFDSIVSLGDFTDNLAPKPGPDGIIRCLKCLNEPPARTIVVGDNLTDMEAGEKSGASTALVLRGRQSTRLKKGIDNPRIDFKLKTLEELKAIIRR